jgi:hypothetical protein
MHAWIDGNVQQQTMAPPAIADGSFFVPVLFLTPPLDEEAWWASGKDHHARWGHSVISALPEQSDGLENCWASRFP